MVGRQLLGVSRIKVIRHPEDTSIIGPILELCQDKADGITGPAIEPC
jgi:hypothetical protein